MATFIERVLLLEDWEIDGGVIDASSFLPLMLQLYAADLITPAAVGVYFNCTPTQQTHLEELLDTRPANITARQAWAIRASSILFAGQSQLAGFHSEAEQRVHLEMDPLAPPPAPPPAAPMRRR